jgi:hypothetical protein
MSAVSSIIIDRIIGPLEKGVVPWNKPGRGGERMPRNLVCRKEYRGVNVFLLHAMAYESPDWLQKRRILRKPWHGNSMANFGCAKGNVDQRQGTQKGSASRRKGSAIVHSRQFS